MLVAGGHISNNAANLNITSWRDMLGKKTLSGVFAVDNQFLGVSETGEAISNIHDVTGEKIIAAVEDSKCIRLIGRAEWRINHENLEDKDLLEIMLKRFEIKHLADSSKIVESVLYDENFYIGLTDSGEITFFELS